MGGVEASADSNQRPLGYEKLPRNVENMEVARMCLISMQWLSVYIRMNGADDARMISENNTWPPGAILEAPNAAGGDRAFADLVR